MKNIYNTLYYLLFTFIVVQNASAQNSSHKAIIYPYSLLAHRARNTISNNQDNLNDTLGKGSNPTINKKMNDSSRTVHGPNSSEILALVGLNNKYGFIDKQGREVIPVKYESIGQNFYEGLVVVRLHGKWGHVDKNGREVVPIKYDWVEDFHDGLALIKRDNKYGFINKKGIEVIPLKYDGAGSFHEGLAMVDLNGKKGFIDTNGKEVIPIMYDFVFDFMKEEPLKK